MVGQNIYTLYIDGARYAGFVGVDFEDIEDRVAVTLQNYVMSLPPGESIESVVLMDITDVRKWKYHITLEVDVKCDIDCEEVTLE